MIQKTDKILYFMISKKMQVIDYLGAFAVLIWAGFCYYKQEDYILYLVVGLIALVFAYIRPTKILVEKTRMMQQQRMKK